MEGSVTVGIFDGRFCDRSGTQQQAPLITGLPNLPRQTVTNMNHRESARQGCKYSPSSIISSKPAPSIMVCVSELLLPPVPVYALCMCPHHTTSHYTHHVPLHTPHHTTHHMTLHTPRHTTHTTSHYTHHIMLLHVTPQHMHIHHLNRSSAGARLIPLCTHGPSCFQWGAAAACHTRNTGGGTQGHTEKCR